MRTLTRTNARSARRLRLFGERSTTSSIYGLNASICDCTSREGKREIVEGKLAFLGFYGVSNGSDSICSNGAGKILGNWVAIQNYV